MQTNISPLFLLDPVNIELRLAVLNFLRILFLNYNQKYSYATLLNKVYMKILFVLMQLGAAVVSE